MQDATGRMKRLDGPVDCTRTSYVLRTAFYSLSSITRIFHFKEIESQWKWNAEFRVKRGKLPLLHPFLWYVSRYDSDSPLQFLQNALPKTFPSLKALLLSEIEKSTYSPWRHISIYHKSLETPESHESSYESESHSESYQTYSIGTTCKIHEIPCITSPTSSWTNVPRIRRTDCIFFCVHWIS